jgi:hypothetical protein
MQRVISYPVITFAISGFLLGTGYAQDKQAPRIVRAPVSQTSPDLSAGFPPLKDPATIDQIREYLRLSGDLAVTRAS